MTDEQIQKAFEGRWRIKTGSSVPATIEGIKELCRDFFEAGYYLSDGIPMSTIVKAAEEVAFSEWWEMYGKKIDRGKCEKKWAKLSPEEKQACIAATPAYVASTPDLQYRRHPMTYLNNKSWENQIIPRNNGAQQPTIQQQRINKLADILAD
ncbi:MAG: hypothetical protein IJ588_13785 [Prevotella sp.]|nr:hypothetical protein [Prevotella sp.]